ncbi:6-bladed beta-propeller [Parabacteroides sp.]|uniref:6-bladed beta-propeller n=1 Tax=Parabacteroides sp. TaxID=1869337 RepID=UPI00257CEBA3|nr:6-bladed beta-propeller [Parabacteroides sp.]
MSKLIHWSLLLLLLFACTAKEEKNVPPTIVVDLNQVPNAQETKALLNRMKIRFVPMENGDSIIYSGEDSRLCCFGDELYVVDAGQDVIFRYDKNGNFINKISRQGEGPEEYIILGDFAIHEGSLFVKDRMKIQVYDLEGNYLRTIPVEVNGDIAFRADGSLIATANYLYPYQLTVYTPDGNKTWEALPSPEQLKSFKFGRKDRHTLGKVELGDSYCFMNYFDPNIYILQDTTVRVLATLDFLKRSMPADYLNKPLEELAESWSDDRMNDTYVFEVSDMVVTENWITFCPPLMKTKASVYYDRKAGKAITNLGFEGIYKMLLGGYTCPDGYNPHTKEFYCLVNVSELQETLIELAERDPDYLIHYPFLEGINPDALDEEANDWAMFFTLD